MTILESGTIRSASLVDEHTGTGTIAVDTTNGDHDKFQHYFHKKAISDNLFTGKPMKALCGRIVAKQTDPKGRTICQECKDILDERYPAE